MKQKFLFAFVIILLFATACGSNPPSQTSIGINDSIEQEDKDVEQEVQSTEDEAAARETVVELLTGFFSEDLEDDVTSSQIRMVAECFVDEIASETGYSYNVILEAALTEDVTYDQIDFDYLFEECLLVAIPELLEMMQAEVIDGCENLMDLNCTIDSETGCISYDGQLYVQILIDGECAPELCLEDPGHEMCPGQVWEEDLDFNFELLTEHPFECLNQELDVFVDVFGIYVISHSSIPTEYVEHSANVVAEFMDNDGNGVMDDPAVHYFLVENNFVVPVWTEALQEEVFPSLRGTFCEDNLGWAASMYYGHDDWAFGGIKQAGTWDTNLEEIWHVLSMGWYWAYPEYFGDRPGSRLADAMDAARGGQFQTVPDSYPEGAWYSYDDYTCDYYCQIHEYFYWILMANIEALDPAYTNKCADSAHEWYVCTKDELQQIDPQAYDLLNNQGFRLPTNIPVGNYQRVNE